MQNNDKLIGTLAVLKSNLIENDFISTYIPFVARALIKGAAADGSIEIPVILESFKIENGFTIDRAPMVTILNKCVRKGLVRKGRNGIYCINKDQCAVCAISDVRVSEKKHLYGQVLNKLQAFYKERYGMDIDVKSVEGQLLSFLNENSAKTLIVSFDFDEKELFSAKQHQYIISQFIAECKKEDMHTFNLISDLATAYLMSSAIAYGDQDVQTQIDSFKNLIIYIDTPLLLKILGLNDSSMQEAILAMMTQLSEMNCSFRIFSHTYDETVCILEDCLRWIEDPNYDEFHASYALRTFVEKRYTKADIQEYIDTLELKLKHYKIKTDDEDYYSGNYFHSHVDEQYIENSIVKTYKEANPSFNAKRKESTIDYDKKSIAFIQKLQAGKVMRTYRQATYVLLTTNTTLAFVTRQFPNGVNPGRNYKVYPCITDAFLGTNIWLGAPIKKIEEFSQKKLLADCMALIEPSEALIHRLQDSIEKAFRDETISKEQYYLLRTKAFSNSYVMQKTLGDEEAFSDRITEELIEEIEKEIKAPYLSKIEELEADNIKYKESEELYQKSEAERGKKLEEEQSDVEKKVDKFISKIFIVVLGGIAVPFAGALANLFGLFSFDKRITVGIIVLSVVLSLASSAINWNWFEAKDKLRLFLIDREKVKRFKKSLKEGRG